MKEAERVGISGSYLRKPKLHGALSQDSLFVSEGLAYEKTRDFKSFESNAMMNERPSRS